MATGPLGERVAALEVEVRATREIVDDIRDELRAARADAKVTTRALVAASISSGAVIVASLISAFGGHP